MLKKIRLTLAVVFLIGLTALFLDFTGTLHAWLGWMANIQLVPAILAVNAGIVIVLVVLTLLLGRVYCSVICPLGLLQDVFARWGRMAKKNRYCYSPAKNILRIAMLVLFVASLVAGSGGILAKLLEPYSFFGRIINNVLAPIYKLGNNALAFLAERMDSYAFYETEVWLKSGLTLGVALVTVLVIAILAWRGGRTYCNTICPVGTVLGFLAKYAWLKPVINTDKCVNCGLCAKRCKAACLNSKEHLIDYSRCVACMNCIGACKKGAISYAHRPVVAKPSEKTADLETMNSRRAFLTASAAVAAATTIKAQEMKVDGGLAAIKDKLVPERQMHLVPPGAFSAQHFAQHCTSCQLCVSVCPNDVLRPSTDLSRLMQPEMSFERGYCRPECTKCSEVCPTDAIKPITREDKSATQIGHAVWVKKNCLSANKGERCDNCARHCPTGAIQMVTFEGKMKGKRPVKIPAINIERCIGCGACENLCPARPFSGIYVEGHESHRTI